MTNNFSPKVKQEKCISVYSDVPYSPIKCQNYRRINFSFALTAQIFFHSLKIQRQQIFLSTHEVSTLVSSACWILSAFLSKKTLLDI